MAMNYDGMNGSDMDTSDSRKRPLDGDVDNGVTKRSNQGGVGLFFSLFYAFRKRFGTYGCLLSAKMAAQRAAGTSPLAVKKFLEFDTAHSESDTYVIYRRTGITTSRLCKLICFPERFSKAPLIQAIQEQGKEVGMADCRTSEH
ncbi:hypothetical protein BaRGS_00026539 [Batillaria attramentaria]|uniref:Uncharacterized protein n=1 Tax=Batillaria attramentaria TaxID=370345 RepID=A0ABD0K5J3_9CAEN